MKESRARSNGRPGADRPTVRGGEEGGQFKAPATRVNPRAARLHVEMTSTTPMRGAPCATRREPVEKGSEPVDNQLILRSAGC